MFEQRAVTSIATLVLVIFLGSLLRKLNILREEHSKLFAGLILKVTLPALIFSSLSQSSLSFENILLAVVMISSMLLSGFLAWIAGKLLKLAGPKMGGLILASSFPSSAFLGYAIVKEIYANNPSAMADAVIISEIGVAIPLFTLGVFIAMHFGNREKLAGEVKKEIVSFLYSPIFISVLLGILTSFLPIPTNSLVIGGFYDMLNLISNANSFLVALCIGVMLHFNGIKKYIFILVVVLLIKLIIQPLFSYGQAIMYNFNDTWQHISILEASMPTAAMTAIFAKKFGDNADLTSVLVFATFLTSCISMIMMLFLLA